MIHQFQDDESNIVHMGGVGAFAEAEPSRRRFDAGTPASVSSPRAAAVPIVLPFCLLASAVERAAASSDRSLDSSASRAKSCAANSVFCARSGAHGSGASPAAIARWMSRSIASAHMSELSGSRSADGSHRRGVSS